MRNLTLIPALAGAALLATCSGDPAGTEPQTASSAETEGQTAEPLTVTVIDCGTIEISDLDGFSSAGDYAGQSDTFTDTCWLVNHPAGRLLWDLGLPGILKQGGPQQNGVFTVSVDETITDQLAKMGLSASDIDYMAISHSHFDHIGQVAQFPDVTWLVHEDELAAMFPPKDEEGDVTAPSDQVAMFALFDPLKKETFTGEKDVFGDGSVIIFETPGHTPGHTSLQVNLPEMGPILLTGDLYHRTESRELKRVPRFNFDEQQTLAAMDAFEARAERLGATVIIQHETDDISPLGTTLK